MNNHIETNVVVVSPRAVSPVDRPPRFSPPMGALWVIPTIAATGFGVSLYDVAAEGIAEDPNHPEKAMVIEDRGGAEFRYTGYDNRTAAEKILDKDPTVVALSCATIVDRGETTALAKQLKALAPNVPIIMGGHEASHWWSDILGQSSYLSDLNPYVDYIVVGPGQPVVSDLLAHIEYLDRFPVPKGVAFRNEVGGVQFTGLPEFDPNRYPLVDFGRYVRKVVLSDGNLPLDIYSFVGNPHAGDIKTLMGCMKPFSYFPMLTSWGCGFNCSYCDTDMPLTRLTVENAIRTFEQFQLTFGVNFLEVLDNNFGGGNDQSRETAFEILHYLADHEIPIGFANGLTFESMHRDDFKLLREFKDGKNVRHIAFPVENGNDRILEMVRKPHRLKQVISTLEKVRDLEVAPNREGFFIGGFPALGKYERESRDELRNTARFIEMCLREQLLTQAIFLTLSPVTGVYRRIWRDKFPNDPFEKALFSQGTDIWGDDPQVLQEMRNHVAELNTQYGRIQTRRL